MKKFGIIFCGYDCDEHINKSLPVWLDLKRKHGENLIFTVCNCLFEEYADMGKTVLPIPEWIVNNKQIDYYYHCEKPVSEAEARNMCLQYLLAAGVDYVFLVDADEYYQEKDFHKVVNFVEANSFITWFKLPLKNYVFDDKTFLVEPFTPPRIFKTVEGKSRLMTFSWDNDVAYFRPDKGFIPHTAYSQMTIPQNIVWPKHLSWCGAPDYLKAKVAYQNKHFNGVCSYRWDEQAQVLKFNEEFFTKYNLPIPRTAKDA